MNVELRPYQKAGINKIFGEWREGKRSVLFQMPTGTGKTTLFSEIVRKAKEKGKRVLIIAHRIELVEQIYDRLRQAPFNIKAGIIAAGADANYKKVVQVASIQTLKNREYPKADLIVIDECHHAKASTYRILWEHYPDAKFLGVTATPIRLDGKGFEDIFDVLVSSPQIKEFIQNKHLAEVKHFVCSNPDLREVKKRAGDYNIEMLKGVMLDNLLMHNLVESYKQCALNKKMIVFAVDREHSKGIVERYCKAGIKAAHIDATTPKQERALILSNFKKGKIKVVSNVDIISEGFDFPACEAVQLARPTQSLALYLQQVGRCMRPSDGKECGIILDNAGLWLEHGIATIDRHWTLECIKKNSKGLDFMHEYAIEDEEGNIRQIQHPQEAEGLELIELTEEQKRILIFERLLWNTVNKNQKVLASYYSFRNYLEDNGEFMTENEFDYVKNRISKLNPDLRPGFWYHQHNELFQHE